MIAADRYITVDEAVELTGVTAAELLARVELTRDRFSAWAVESWVARRGALSMLDLFRTGPKIQTRPSADVEEARAEKLAELANKLDQVAGVVDSVRRANHVIATALGIILLESKRRELEAFGEKVDILGRVAFRLRSSLGAHS